MVKIEKTFYPVCVRVNKDAVATCRNAAYGKDINVLLETEIEEPYSEELLLAFVFETEMSKTLFLCTSGCKETYFPIAFKISGSIEEKNEIRKKIADIGLISAETKEKKMSAGTPLKNEYGILVLMVFESSKALEKVETAIANK